MSLIGRERELAELDARLRSHRLITIVGPGGVGKTALARAGAVVAAERFPLGVRDVDLTRIDNPQEVPGALAAQLGFDSFEALLASPGDRPALLVVDNCEHLLDAAAGAVGALLDACRMPTVIATSRSPLELPGETVMSLAPLPVPQPGADALECAAVQLFLARARDAGAVPADAVPGGDELDTVAHLCRRLDGLPLAIEIAAARARTLSVAEILDRLAGGVAVLDRPRYRGAVRHRSVAETIRWSYDLLRPDEADLFDRLGVFTGPFDTAAARHVAGFDADDERFAGLLDELVHASLVVADTSGPKTRYRLLDTLRRFALDRLQSDDRLGGTYDHFVDHVLDTQREAIATASTRWHPGVLQVLVESYDNIAEAVRWCNRHDTDAHRSLLLCAPLWAVVHQGRAEDILHLARQTLDRWPPSGRRLHAEATATLATAEYVCGDPARAIELAEASLARLASPTLASVTLRRVIGQSRRALGDHAGSMAAFAEGATMARDSGFVPMAVELDVARATVLADMGDIDAALAVIGAAIEESTRNSSEVTEVWAQATRAWIRVRAGAPDGLALAQDVLARALAIDYPIAIVVSLRSIAVAQMLADQLAGATSTLRELLDDLLHRGALADARILVDATAALAHRAGLAEWERLAATARVLPIASLVASAGNEVSPPPATDVEAIPRIAAIHAVRDVLDGLAAGAPVAAPSVASAVGSTEPVASIVRRGEVWEITYAGSTVSVRASKGLADLVQLLAAPDREISCIDLAGAATEQTSTGEVIDATARRAYEERIRDLQEDIESAEADNDFARADRAQAELDTLVEHLTAALGHGGRTRKGADTAERARSAVTQRLRSTVRQVGQVHPELGRHLQASVRTGLYCSYRPERPTPWHIR